MTGASITFEDLPPAPKGGRAPSRLNQIIAAQLRERPGEWAHVRTRDSSTRAASLAYHIRVGTSPVFQPKGTYEAASRYVAGEHRVYARYVGDAGEDQQ